jgi:hypothetical protein
LKERELCRSLISLRQTRLFKKAFWAAEIKDIQRRDASEWRPLPRHSHLLIVFEEKQSGKSQAGKERDSGRFSQ